MFQGTRQAFSFEIEQNHMDPRLIFRAKENHEAFVTRVSNIGFPETKHQKTYYQAAGPKTRYQASENTGPLTRSVYFHLLFGEWSTESFYDKRDRR